MFVRVKIISHIVSRHSFLLEFTGPGHAPQVVEVTREAFRQLAESYGPMSENRGLRVMDWEESATNPHERA